VFVSLIINIVLLEKIQELVSSFYNGLFLGDDDVTMDRGLNDSHMGTAETRQIAKQKRDRIASSL